MIYKIILTLTFSIVVGLTDVFSQNSLNIQNVDNILEAKLLAIEIDNDYFSPSDGVDITVAKTNIVNELKKEGIKGDINSEIKVNEITTNISWQNMGIQIYRVMLDYAWLDGVALIKNKKVLTILRDMSLEAIFLADLDKDNIYEIYTNYLMGSGIVSEKIEGYNISLNEKYNLSMRMIKDLKLFIENRLLKVEVKPYKNYDEKIIIKNITLKKINNKNELIILEFN